jgi:HD-GYP domain-containing protein (c-di-GMP phosphodiesterase class II)
MAADRLLTIEGLGTQERRLPLRRFGASLHLKQIEARLAETQRALICAFSQMLDLKDLNTGAHSTRLAEWGVRVAQELSVEPAFVPDVETACLLHDIGKVGVPDSILNKPGKLDPDEMELIQRHPAYGWAILRVLPGFERVSLYVLHHHERYDGQGYPGRLGGNDVPIGSRIVSVVDAFDAMVSSRPYRAGLSLAEACRRLQQAAGSQFDPEVVRSFVAIAETGLPEIIAATGTAALCTA